MNQQWIMSPIGPNAGIAIRREHFEIHAHAEGKPCYRCIQRMERAAGIAPTPMVCNAEGRLTGLSANTLQRWKREAGR